MARNQHHTNRERLWDKTDGREAINPQPIRPTSALRSAMVQPQARGVGYREPRPYTPTHPSRHHQKPLPSQPEEADILDYRSKQANAPGSTLYPRRLSIRKKLRFIDPSQEIRGLREQNGYLRAEVAHLDETRCALSALQGKTQDAFLLLQSALEEVARKLARSDQRMMNYWGLHAKDGFEEHRAF